LTQVQREAGSRRPSEPSKVEDLRQRFKGSLRTRTWSRPRPVLACIVGSVILHGLVPLGLVNLPKAHSPSRPVVTREIAIVIPEPVAAAEPEPPMDSAPLDVISRSSPQKARPLVKPEKVSEPQPKSDQTPDEAIASPPESNKESTLASQEGPGPAAPAVTQATASTPMPSDSHSASVGLTEGPPSQAGPIILYGPAPKYPPEAKAARKQGTVRIRVLISAEGAVSRAVVEQSSGTPSLDAAAVRTVATWRFSPMIRDAHPAAVWAVVPVVFALRYS
jgi:periplasmic protein TonB